MTSRDSDSKHPSVSKHKNDEDELTNLRHLKEFYSIYDPKFVDTVDAHIARLKRRYKSKFSWENVWTQCQKKYGVNPRDLFLTSQDFEEMARKDADVMDRIAGAFSTLADEGTEVDSAPKELVGGTNGVKCKSFIDTTLPLEIRLQNALENLRRAGGKELSFGDDSNEEDKEGPSRYMIELLDVCDIRYMFGDYELAGANYFRCYNIAMIWYQNSSGKEKNLSVFPIAHKWLQSWTRSGNENLIQFAYVMSLKLVKLADCPRYIKKDKERLEVMSSPLIKAAEIVERNPYVGIYTSNQITLPNSIATKSSVQEKENCSPPSKTKNTNNSTTGF